MISIRIHGRGGQGVVAAAELIALAAFKQGYEAQSLPFFGVERSGAPIQAFVRIDREKIITHAQVVKPDYIIILDDSLSHNKEIFQGLHQSSHILINSDQGVSDIRKIIGPKYKDLKIQVLDANKISFQILKRIIINTALLGAFCAQYKIIKKDKALAAIDEKFQNKGRSVNKLNQKIFLTAYEQSLKQENK
ncbi:MAG: 2-oxoacid:acceptor oxidoreductase family protein [Patescibacteria group bacterium]|jgi:2-oxoacid:acceptor oxidoreductase gamma subunit (pyruvate/2-ketoisovalerate family)|nr:2-oxoacid:acceptor oxidoreductase family protein [Patescibacteria group bacterium]